MGFPDDCAVVVKQVNEKDWLTRAAMQYTGKVDTFTVPEDSPTDFASVPRIFVWFLPRYGRYTKAAILHDYLWRNQVKQGDMKWRDADALFRRAMRELQVPFLRRWIMWSAVRWAALKNGAWRERGAIRDLPLMLLFTLIALPILLPPAAVILLAWLAWFFVEAIVWAPLKIGEFVQRQLLHNEAAKQVNRPGLDWKL